MMLWSGLLLVCKTISSSWSARPTHLLGQADQLSIKHIFMQIMVHPHSNVAGLQDHPIFLVCRTISSSWSARPVVHQTYLVADHGASSLGGGSQRQPPSSFHSVVGTRTFGGYSSLDNCWQWPVLLPRKSLKGSWGGVCPEKKMEKFWICPEFFPEKKLEGPLGRGCPEKKILDKSRICPEFFFWTPPSQGSFQNFFWKKNLDKSRICPEFFFLDRPLPGHRDGNMFPDFY